MSKIQLELGGKYSAGEMFKRANGDLKAFGRSNKDAIKAGTDSLKELEKGFGEDLSKSIGTAKGVLQGLAQGGIWGALGAVAGAAIGFVVEKFKEAKENAKHFAEACGEFVTSSIKRIGETFRQTSADIAFAKQEMKDFADIAQGATVNAANAKIHQLHIETLQKITDGMSESGKKVLLADEKVAEAKIRQSLASDIATQKEKEQQQRIEQASKALVAAKEKLASIQDENRNMSVKESQVISKYLTLKAEETGLVIASKEGTISQNYATRKMAEVQEKLAEIMEGNKGTIEGHKAIVEALAQAEGDVTKAQRDLAHEQNALILVQQQNRDALLSADAALADATQARRQATLAQEKENETLRKKTSAEEDKAILEETENELKREDIEVVKECYRLKIDEARYLALYNRLRREGATQEEALYQLSQQYFAAKKNEKKITEVCAKYKLDEKEYIKKFNEMTDKGISEVDAYAQLQRDLNDQLKERTKAERKATKEANESTSDDPEGKKGKKMVVTLSAGCMGDIGETVEQKLSFKDWQEKARQELRKGRDEKNNMKIDQPKMVKALEGKMPQAEAKQWMEYAKTKYTPDQMRELGKLAMNTELLSKKEQQRQLEAVEQMAKEIAKSLAIR